MKKFVAVVLLWWMWVAGAEAITPLVSVEIRGLGPFLEELDRFAADVTSDQDAPKDQIRSSVGRAIGNPNFKGMDLGRTVQLAWIAPEGQENSPAMVAVVPVVGEGSEFLEQMEEILEFDEGDDGIWAAETLADDVALPQEFYMAFKKGWAVLGMRREHVRGILDELGEQGWSRIAIQTPGQAAVAMWLAEIGKALSAKLPPSDEAQSVAKAFLKACKQFEVLELGALLEDPLWTLSGRARPIEGTLASRCIRSLKPVSSDFASVAPAEALAAAVGNVGCMDELLSAYSRWLGQVLSLTPMAAEFSESLGKLFDMMAGQFSGEFVSLIAEAEGDVGMVQVARVLRPDEATTLVDRMAAVMNEFAEDASSWGAPVSTTELQEPREYKGIAIKRYRTKMQLDDVPMPLQTWFQGGRSAESAVVNDLLISVYGSSALMDRMVDIAQEGGGRDVRQADVVRNLLPDLPPKAVSVGWARLGDLLRRYSRTLPPEIRFGDDLPENLALGIATYSVVQDGDLHWKTRVRRGDVVGFLSYLAGGS